MFSRTSRVIIFTFIKIVWNQILNAISWVTQDSHNITHRKRQREIDYIRLRGSGRR